MVHRGKTTRSAMFFFEVLLFTDKNDAGFFGVSRPKTAASFLHDFFDILPYADDAVNGKTSKKSMQKRRGGFWCV